MKLKVQNIHSMPKKIYFSREKKIWTDSYFECIVILDLHMHAFFCTWTGPDQLHILAFLIVFFHLSFSIYKYKLTFHKTQNAHKYVCHLQAISCCSSLFSYSIECFFSHFLYRHTDTVHFYFIATHYSVFLLQSTHIEHCTRQSQVELLDVFRNRYWTVATIPMTKVWKRKKKPESNNSSGCALCIVQFLQLTYTNARASTRVSTIVGAAAILISKPLQSLNLCNRALQAKWQHSVASTVLPLFLH